MLVDAAWKARAFLYRLAGYIGECNLSNKESLFKTGIFKR